MIILTGEYELIQYLKKQDLTNNNLILNTQGIFTKNSIEPPYYISGYLADKKTGSFPIGERFRLTITWDNKEDIENSIKRIKQEIREYCDGKKKH